MNSYKQYVDLLNSEYKDAFNRIEIYIKGAVWTGDVYVIDLIMSEVLDIFISAQKDHVDIKTVIGDDYQLFAQQMIEAYQMTINLGGKMSFAKLFQWIMIIIFIYEAAAMSSTTQSNRMLAWRQSTEFTWLVIITCIVASIGFTIWSKFQQSIAFNKKINPKILGSIFSVIGWLMVDIILDVIKYKYNFENIIPRYIIFPLTIIIFVLLTIYIREDKRKRKSSLSSYFINFDTIEYNEIITQYRIAYKKYQERAIKQQTEPINVKSWYENKHQKEIKNNKNIKIAFILTTAVIIVWQIVIIDILLAFIFSLIFIVIEIFLYKMLEKTRIKKDKIYQDIKSQGIDIFEYSLLRSKQS